jgi:hypothetical protein
VERFTAVGRWDGEHWVVSVDKPPNFGSAEAKGHSRTEAQDGATELLAILLDHRNFTVEVTFEEESHG